jgi:hypothetical protein
LAASPSAAHARLPAVTRTLGHAVEALPWKPKAGELGAQVFVEA